MINTIALTGAPGSGKTTLMRRIIPLLGDPADVISHNVGTDGRRLNFAKATIYPMSRVVLWGLYDGSPYDGTDRLGRNVLPAAVMIVRSLGRMTEFYGWVMLLEGDRLVTTAFLDECKPFGPILLGVVTTPEADIAERAAARTAAEDAEWLKKAVPKVAGKPRRAGRINGQDPNWAKGRATKVRNLTSHYNTMLLPNGTLDEQDESFAKLAAAIGLLVPISMAGNHRYAPIVPARSGREN